MKDDFASTIDQLFNGAIDTLSIELILTHGKEGCVAGTIVLADGRSIRFCDVYLFSSHGKTAKIKKITSHSIDVEGLKRAGVPHVNRRRSVDRLDDLHGQA